MSQIDITSLPVYRIIHIDNLAYILENGIYVRGHKMFDPNYVNIGNSDIIDVRKSCPVRIKGYGYIGEYVPFYFGTQSIMLYNILTGYGGLQKCDPDAIIYLCSTVGELINNYGKFFFTDGQANQHITEHFTDLKNLQDIDWNVIGGSDFKKSAEDVDKPRRYQAEFLIYEYVPIKCIMKIVIHNKSVKASIDALLQANGSKVQVEVAKKDFYFHF